MIRMITPLCVSKHPFNNTHIYAIALVFSTTFVGLVVGTIGTWLRSTLQIEVLDISIWIIVTIILAFCYGFHHLGLMRMPMPQNQWQVPAHWIRYGKSVMAFLYGAVLGAEVFTLIPYATFYILALLEFNLGTGYGALLGFVYGVARAAPVIASTRTIYNSGEDISEEICIVKTEDIVERIWVYSSSFIQINGLVLIAIAIFLMFAVIKHIFTMI